MKILNNFPTITFFLILIKNINENITSLNFINIDKFA